MVSVQNPSCSLYKLYTLKERWNLILHHRRKWHNFSKILQKRGHPPKPLLLHTEIKAMAGRRERCSWCGLQLLVPPEAQTIQCAACQAVTPVRPNDPWVQVHDSIYNAANRFKSLVNSAVATASLNSYPASNTSVDGYYYPRPPGPTLPLIPPNSHGRKRALLCGVSYYGRGNKLKGSVNDVRCMRYFLVEKLGFPNDSILILTGIC